MIGWVEISFGFSILFFSLWVRMGCWGLSWDAEETQRHSPAEPSVRLGTVSSLSVEGHAPLEAEGQYQTYSLSHLEASSSLQQLIQNF